MNAHVLTHGYQGPNQDSAREYLDGAGDHNASTKRCLPRQLRGC